MYDPRKPYKHCILSLIRQTWRTPYVRVQAGAYPVIEKKFSLPEVQHTDGIGTKGIYHWKARTFRAAVLDALAMNLNDLALSGATPFALQNHIVLPKDDHGAILAIVRELTRECKKRNIAMTGGETSIHDDASGMDISITVSGFIRERRPVNRFRIGDALIGFKSNGLHANGFTKVREIFGERARTEFVRPTAIYADIVQCLLERYRTSPVRSRTPTQASATSNGINGMMHITGGAFTKLKDLLKGADAYIMHSGNLKPQPIFYELNKKGVPSREMYVTFNCGIGFVISTLPEIAEHIISSVRGTAIIGRVAKGSGKVKIVSAFDGRPIRL